MEFYFHLCPNCSGLYIKNRLDKKNFCSEDCRISCHYYRRLRKNRGSKLFYPEG